MTTGTVVAYDADNRRGFVVTDRDKENERLPFDLEKDAPPLQVGDHVAFDIRGGMAGLVAVDLRKL